MADFPYPYLYHNLTEEERNQAMLIYHTMQLYKMQATLRRIGTYPEVDQKLFDYRRKKIEEYQKKVLTNC